MTEQEKAAALAQKQAEMERTIREAVQGLRAQFDACPFEGEPCTPVEEEEYLTMPDGVRLYMQIYKPAEKDFFPVLVQRSCYPQQAALYQVYGEELARRG